MSAAAARRKARYRQRQRDGRSIYALDLPDIDVFEALVSAGFLSPGDVEDHERVRFALERLVEVLVSEGTRPDRGF